MTSFRPSLPSSRWRPTQLQITALRTSGWLLAVPLTLLAIAVGGAVMLTRSVLQADVSVEGITASAQNDGSLQFRVLITQPGNDGWLSFMHTQDIALPWLECPRRATGSSPGTHPMQHFDAQQTPGDTPVAVDAGQPPGDKLSTTLTFVLDRAARAELSEQSCVVVVPVGSSTMRLSVPTAHAPHPPGSSMPIDAGYSRMGDGLRTLASMRAPAAAIQPSGRVRQ